MTATMLQSAPVSTIALLPNGLRLEFVDQGDRQGIPLLLLHGYSDSWRSFAPVLPYLPPHIRAIAVTQRGHDGIDHPGKDYSFEAFANDVDAFVRALDLGPAIVAGHSFGSTVAQRYAGTRPDQVLGLVLEGASTTWHGNPVLIEVDESSIAALTDPISPAFVRAWQADFDVPAAIAADLLRDALRIPARVWREGMRTILTTECPADPAMIAAPTLIIWGDQDPLCPRADQDALTGAIPNAHHLTYAGNGHTPHWDEPERFAADLVAFAEHHAR